MSGDRAEIAVEVRDLAKTYGSVTAVRSVSFEIEAGRYFVLLGPSGGGKTTLLRLIGGFIRPTAGRILLHGRDVTDLAPNLRPTSMVFQSYALFPHMSVARNVAYGLRLRKLAKAEIGDKVDRMLDLTGLAGLHNRMPHELSGGQQQRVQLARSLVLESDILLLDEPLASLDAKLRKDMCFELKHLQEKVGITFIHVTHDQSEAMTIADRIAIVAAGNLVETGAARDIYERPRRRFTAGFVGENNIFDGQVTALAGDTARVRLGPTEVRVPLDGAEVAVGQAVGLAVRSEQMRITESPAEEASGSESLAANYQNSTYLGLVTRHALSRPDGTLVEVRTVSDGAPAPAPGQAVLVTWPTAEGRLLLD